MDKRLLVYSDIRLDEGSAARSRLNIIASELLEAGWDVYFYDSKHAIFIDHIMMDKSKGRKVKVCFFKRFIFFLRNLFRFKRFLEQKKIRTVYFYGRRFFPIYLFNKISGVKNSILEINEWYSHFDGFGSWLSPNYWNLFMGSKFLPHSMSKITVINRELITKVGRKDISNICLLPGLQNFDSKYVPGSNEEIRLLYMGVFYERDRPDFLIKLMTEINNINPDVKFQCVGRFNKNRKSDKYIRLILENPSLSKATEFYDNISDQGLSILRAECTAFLMPRRDHINERLSFPTRFVEFLSLRKPIITHALGEISINFIDGKSIIFLEENCLVSALKINSILKNHSLMDEIASCAFNKGRFLYDAATNVRGLEKFLLI